MMPGDRYNWTGFLGGKAKARRTDPSTSHQAARNVEALGTASDQRSACLREVWRKPGQTAAEIAAAVGLERHAPSRRLPELREVGSVMNGHARMCNVQGTQSMTWWPVRSR